MELLHGAPLSVHARVCAYAYVPVCVALGMKTGERPGPLLAGRTPREGSELPALSLQMKKLSATIEENACLCSAWLFEPQQMPGPLCASARSPGRWDADGMIRVLGGLQLLEKCLLLIFSTHTTYLPHLPKSTGFLCLPEVWDWLLGQPGLGL